MSQVITGAGRAEGKIRKPRSSLGGGGGGAPTDAQYVVITTNPTLTQERVLTAGTGVSIVDAGAGSTVTISLSGASVPAGTEQHQHLEWSGVAWGIVDHLTLGTTSTPAAELRLRSTTNRIYASGASVMVIDSPRIDIHESGGLIARFDGSALQMQSTNAVQFNTTSQKIAANGTDRIDYTAPISHDFRIGATLYARIEANAFSLDPTDGSFIPTFDSSVAGALRLFDSFGAAEVLRWTGTYQRMAGTNLLEFNQSTEYIYSPAADYLELGAAEDITAQVGTAFNVSVGVVQVASFGGSGITLASSSDLITTSGQLILNGTNGSILQYNSGNRVSATSAGVTLFDGAAGVDYTITLDGETNNCVLTWMEDEDYLQFSDDVLMASTERIYFEDTNQYIYSPSAAVLTIASADASSVLNLTSSGTSGEVNIQATSNMSVRIAGADEYFVFERAASGIDYASKFSFRGNDDGVMSDVGSIRGLSSVSGAILEIATYISTTKTFNVSNTAITMFPANLYSGSFTGSSTNFRLTATSFTIESGSLAWTYDGSLSAFTCGSNFTFGCSSASSRSLTLNNIGGGAFTCNIISSSEWSFTSTTLTIGDANNIAVGTGTGTKIGTATTQKLGFLNATPIAQQANTADLKDTICGFGFQVNGGASPLNLDGGALTAGSITVGGASTSVIDHGTYTPTLTNTTNISASTAYQCQYLRVGNTVTVSGKVDIDPTIAAKIDMGMSLPIASNFGATEDCAGAGAYPDVANMGVGILADVTNDRARFIGIPTSVTNDTLYFTFTYQVI